MIEVPLALEYVTLECPIGCGWTVTLPRPPASSVAGDDLVPYGVILAAGEILGHVAGSYGNRVHTPAEIRATGTAKILAAAFR